LSKHPLNSRSQGILSWPFAPLQSLTALAPLPTDKLEAASSLAVSSPSAYSRYWAATYFRKEPPFGSGAFSAFPTLSRPSSAQHLPAILGLVPPVGFPLQGPDPLAEHPTLSSSAALMRLSSVLLLPQPNWLCGLPRFRPSVSSAFVEAARCAVRSSPGPSSPRASVSFAFFLKSGKGPRPSWASPP
jgi:hypothetical protein